MRIISQLDLPIDSICADYLSGLTLLEVGNKYGCSPSAVKFRLKDRGLTPRTNKEAHIGKYTGIENYHYLILDDDEMIKDYLNCDSPSKIAKKFGCHADTVRRHLIAKNIKLRSYKESHLTENEPLSDGWKSKNIATNKTCSNYLGDLTEILLSKTFKDVKVMPTGNSGYDFICNKDYKIDAKSAATGNKGYWYFSINKNKIADYFCCIGFNNREDVKPVHFWLIPGDVVNNVGGIRILKSTLSKWSKYEQTIEKVVLCCDTMKVSNG